MKNFRQDVPKPYKEVIPLVLRANRGDEIIYTWYADKEGVYLFHDMADARSSEDGTNIHGLFGAMIVEPPEAKWLDPETGEDLESGLFADIYPPTGPAFREYAIFFHDELEIKDKNGEQP